MHDTVCTSTCTEFRKTLLANEIRLNWIVNVSMYDEDWSCLLKNMWLTDQLTLLSAQKTENQRLQSRLKQHGLTWLKCFLPKNF